MQNTIFENICNDHLLNNMQTGTQLNIINKKIDDEMSAYMIDKLKPYMQIGKWYKYHCDGSGYYEEFINVENERIIIAKTTKGGNPKYDEHGARIILTFVTGDYKRFEECINRS